MAGNRARRQVVDILILTWCSFTLAANLGGNPTDIFEQGIMARASAIGGAARTVVDDSGALFYNSALLGALRQQDLQMSNTRLLGDTTYTFASMGFVMLGGTLALNAGILHTPGIEKHLSAVTPSLTPDGLFSAGDYFGIVGYGQRLMGDLYGGIAFRYEQRQIDQTSDQIYAADLGILWKSPSWTWSANLKNILVMKGSDTQDNYSPMVELGVQWCAFKWLKIMGDVTRLGTGNPHYFLGLESDWLLRLRAGINEKEYGIGCGIVFDPVRVDYAYVVLPEEVQHRVSFGLVWGDDF